MTSVYLDRKVAKKSGRLNEQFIVVDVLCKV